MMYCPREPFTTTAELFNPTYENVQGVNKKKYKSSGILQCLFKTYGGTEVNINNVYGVIDTATIETWFRPDITSASLLKIGNKSYEVVGEPEDINQRHKYIKMKVRGKKGGA